MNFSSRDVINEVKGWTPPTFSQGKECYVSFYAFDPTTGRMKRKKIMLGKIKGKMAQRKYAQGVIHRLTEKLLDGWNPWIEASAPMEYTYFTEVCDRYSQYLYKMVEDNDMREETLASYLSSLRMLQKWGEREAIVYIYQLNRRKVCEFLDYVFIERNNTLQTRNNYLAWLRTFCNWLLQRAYLSANPTEGMTAVQRRAKKKNRDVLPDEALQKLHDHLERTNKHFLLACYLLHYMFIRPHEMTYIKICDIHPAAQTLELHGENTKNHNDAVLTMPAKVIHLMVDLCIFNSPGRHYLFSTGFMPGSERQSEKFFRDYWHRHVRKDLDFPSQYKLYSLKDTGITNMLKANHDVLTVRDQARHSSILITDTYTPKDIQNANKALLNYEGIL